MDRKQEESTPVSTEGVFKSRKQSPENTLSLSCISIGSHRGVLTKSTFIVSLALSCLSKNLQLK